MTSSGRHGPPHDKIRDRAVVDGRAQLLLASAAASGRGRPWLQEPHSGRTRPRSCRSAAPSTAHSASSGWTWMESGSLVNSSLSRSEGAVGVGCAGPLVPDFTDRDAIVGRIAPRASDRRHPKALAGPAHAQVRSPWCSTCGARFEKSGNGDTDGAVHPATVAGGGSRRYPRKVLTCFAFAWSGRPPTRTM